MTGPAALKLLASPEEYGGDPRIDPIRFYYYPVLGKLYRRRVEICLNMLGGGDRVLEIGFGSGATFLSLAEKYREVWGLDLNSDCAKVASIFGARGLSPKLCNGSVLETPYPDNHFDAVLLVSVLEHLQKDDLPRAFSEISRVLKPGGMAVYGVPVDRPIMTLAFRMLGYDIREHHFSTERDVAEAGGKAMKTAEVARMRGFFGLGGPIYEVARLLKPGA